MPISFAFFSLLMILAMSAATLPAVAKAPQEVWFIVNQQAGGTWLLAMAGLGGITTGIVALALNLAIYVVVGLVVPASAAETSRVARLFEAARAQPAPAPAPAPAAGGE